MGRENSETDADGKHSAQGDKETEVMINPAGYENDGDK
jgi:hypothetical protein